MQYDASGLLPARDASIVGQNWNIVCGGRVTRLVKGIADENLYPSYGDYMAQKTDNMGYLYGIRNSSIYGEPRLPSFLLDIAANFKQIDGIMRLDLNYEHEPDLFTVQIGTTVFNFMIDNRGNVQVLYAAPHKVDISGLALQRSGFPYSNSSIRVTTDDGYIYVFGGNENTVELSYPLDYSSSNRPIRKSQQCVVNAWYLTKIIHPSGEAITLEYTPQAPNLPDDQDANYIEKEKYFTPGYVVYGSETEDRAVGGARIKKVVQSTGDSTEYIYGSSQKRHTGVYLAPPTYGYNYWAKQMVTGDVYGCGFTAKPTNIYEGSSVPEPCVGYSFVQQKLADGSKVNYYYTNFLTHPDVPLIFPHSFKVEFEKVREDTKSDFRRQMTQMLTYSSCAQERGKLIKKEIFDHSGVKVAQEEFTYNDSPDRSSLLILGSHVAYASDMHEMAYTYGIFHYPNHITRHLKKQYFESDSVCEDIEYEYDGWKRSEFVHDYANRESQTLSNGEVKIREYKRVADYPLLIKYSTRAERGLFILQRHRIWNLMVEESLYLRKRGQQTRSLLKSEIREYTQATPFINKTPSYGDSLFHLGAVYQTALQDPLASYEPSRVENNRFTYTSALFRKKISYDRYGHTGNLLEYTDDREVPCSYIWGCYNQLPIAEIKGVRYSQIEDLYGGGTNGYWSLFYQGVSLKLSPSFF